MAVGLSSILRGCTNAKTPAPILAVSVPNVATNSNGVTLTLHLTNSSSKALLVSVRSVIHQTNGNWFTNFGAQPMFSGLADPGSQASDVTLAPGSWLVTSLSPITVPGAFQIEFVCFPSREGLTGIGDRSEDKIRGMVDGTSHESFLGESFFVTSPVVNR